MCSFSFPSILVAFSLFLSQMLSPKRKANCLQDRHIYVYALVNEMWTMPILNGLANNHHLKCLKIQDSRHNVPSNFDYIAIMLIFCNHCSICCCFLFAAGLVADVVVAAFVCYFIHIFFFLF